MCPFFPPISTKWEILRSKVSFYVIICLKSKTTRNKTSKYPFSKFSLHRAIITLFSEMEKPSQQRSRKFVSQVFFKGKCVISLQVLISHKTRIQDKKWSKGQRWSLHTGKGTIKGEDIIVQFTMMSCSII